jgi:DNA-binding transcriptional MerR regulator
MTSIKPYVLRYWETEFPQLRPAKNRAGNRIYKNHDVELVFQIKKLLYNEKFTIEGAKSKVKELKKKRTSQLNLSFADGRKEKIIKSIRDDLIEVINLLEK